MCDKINSQTSNIIKFIIYPKKMKKKPPNDDDDVDDVYSIILCD